MEQENNKKNGFLHFFDVMIMQTLITGILLLGVLVTVSAKPAIQTIFGGGENIHSLEALAEKIIILFDDDSAPAMAQPDGAVYPDIDDILKEVYSQQPEDS